MTSAVILDFDGTLVDLDVDIERVRAEISALRRAAGLSAEARPILPALRELEERDAAAGGRAREVLDAAERAAASRARILPTVAEVLDDIARSQRPWAVVSNNGRACVARGLERLGAVPALIVSRDDVAAPKPDPEGLIRVATELGAPAVFIGDGLADAGAAESARARGVEIQFVAVRGPRTDEAALRQAGVEVYANLSSAVAAAPRR